MKIVTYPKTLQWVGSLKCPACAGLTPAWRSSGMSEAFPHFYCDRCSNVIHRQADKDRVWNEATQAILNAIAATLPACPCGGQFRPGTGPKCAHCGQTCAPSASDVSRLRDPHMIVVDGACCFSDVREPYRVKIVDEAE